MEILALSEQPRLWRLTRLFKVPEGDLVDGEEADGGVVLWAHVGDGGPVGGRQLGDAGAKKLHKLPSDPGLPQVLQNQRRSYVSKSVFPVTFTTT